MPGTPSDLPSTCLTVERLTATASPIWGNRDLTTAIAVAVGLLDAREETRVKARGEGNLGPFDSLWKRRGGRKRERDKSYMQVTVIQTLFHYMSENELTHTYPCRVSSKNFYLRWKGMWQLPIYGIPHKH